LGSSGGIFFSVVGSRRDTASTRAKRALQDDAFARDDGSKMDEPEFSDFSPIFDAPGRGKGSKSKRSVDGEQ
jgi:hypothetical protein